MFQAARNDYRITIHSKQRGIALLVMLAMIMVAFTTIAISRLSQNSGEQKARAKTTQALIQSRDAIMAFAVARDTDAQPPGTLPCPDRDGDGESDPVGAGPCQNYRGLVPFVTLGIQQPFDGAGAPIWYVVPSLYTGTPAQPHNSSKAPNLQLNSQAVAFILFAPNIPIASQNRPVLLPYKNPPAGMFAQYLEGLNAGASPLNYSDVQTLAQNDQVLSVSSDYFWTNVEERVLAEVRNILEIYHSSCNAYPFAADYSVTGQPASNDSKANMLEGRLPLNLALPTDWGQSCGSKTAPLKPDPWLVNHWGDSLYYALCPQSTPNCLRLMDGAGNNISSVSALILAPGIPIPTRPARTSGTRTGFFELENAVLTPANTYTQVKPFSDVSRINDLIYTVH